MIGRNYLKCGSPKRVKMDILISALLRIMYNIDEAILTKVSSSSPLIIWTPVNP